MKETLLTLFLVSLSFLLLVSALWFTKERWTHYRGGKLTPTGRMYHYLTELRRQRRIYRSNYSFFKVLKKLSFSSTKMKPVSWRRKQWLRSYRLGKLRLLIYQTRTRMLLTHCRIMTQKRLGKLSGTLRRISQTGSSKDNRS